MTEKRRPLAPSVAELRGRKDAQSGSGYTPPPRSAGVAVLEAYKRGYHGAMDGRER